MAIDTIPHDFADKATDVVETRPTIKLCHPLAHLITATFADKLARGVVIIGFARTGADAGVFLHACDKRFKIAGWQNKVEVEFAKVLKPIHINRIETRIKRFNHTWANSTMAAIGLWDHTNPVMLRCIFR